MTRSKSGLGRPIDADGDATRSRIVAAARAAFAEFGYAATTYRLLADRTALAPSALYNYFSSKAHLYRAVYDQVQHEIYTDWITPAIAGTTTFAARIDALLGSFAAMNAAAPEVARFQAAARVDTVRHPELASVHDGMPTQRRGLFVEMVDLGIATGELPASARATVLAMLEALTLGLVEISAEPALHHTAIDGFRRAIAAQVRPVAPASYA